MGRGRSIKDSLKVVYVTKETARLAGHYIRNYKKRGRQIDFVDAVIAATCVLEEMSLVTYNIKHYPMTELVKISLLVMFHEADRLKQKLLRQKSHDNRYGEIVPILKRQ